MQKLHEGRLGVCTKGLLTVVRQMLLGAFEIRLTLSILYPIPFSIFLSLYLSLFYSLFVIAFLYWIVRRNLLDDLPFLCRANGYLRREIAGQGRS